MARSSTLSHVMITHTTKPHGAGTQNLGARARKTDAGLKSPEYTRTFKHGEKTA